MGAGLPEISVVELADRLRRDPRPLILDVRESWEHQLAHIEGTEDVPMDAVPDQMDRLRGLQGPDRVLCVLCHRGNRSRLIARFLQQNGFERVINVAGGIEAWSAEVDPSMVVY